MTAITIRDVPERVRQTLADEARERGQSLQAYLLSVLTQQADFSHNRQLMLEIEDDFARHGGGVSDDEMPRAAEVIRQARREAGRE